MTSVLYSSGLNYQGRNPMGNELRALERRLGEVEGSFSGVKSHMEAFIASQQKPVVATGPSEADKKIAELQALVESLQTSIDILKARVDKGDAAIASASAAATQAKMIATTAAADAASAAASAAAAAAATPSA